MGYCLALSCHYSPHILAQMLLILLSIIDNNGALEKKDFAKRMQEWMQKGFPELGDAGLDE